MPSDADEIAALKIEVARLGRLVEALYIRLDGIAPDGTVDPGDPPQDVVAALRAGNEIMAIKLWREKTGLGLAESKHQVEQIRANLR